MVTAMQVAIHHWKFNAKFNRSETCCWTSCRKTVVHPTNPGSFLQTSCLRFKQFPVRLCFSIRLLQTKLRVRHFRQSEYT